MPYPTDEYRIIPDPKAPEKWCVELLTRKYRGILFAYGAFEINPQENGPCRLKFEHEAIYIPEHLRGVEISLEERQGLIQLLGDILVDIIDKNLGNGEVKDGKFVLKITKASE